MKRPKTRRWTLRDMNESLTSGLCVYLQETVISIFVAGTMELTGSKSLIDAMTEDFPDHLSIREVRT